MSKESTLSETYLAMQSLQQCTLDTLTEHLRSAYSSEWAEKLFLTARKQVDRDLKVLIKMGLVEKDTQQKAHLYRIKRNLAFKSEASQHFDTIKNILKDQAELFQKIREPLSKIMNELESPYFIKKNVENISDKVEIISKLEHAINNRLFINLSYLKNENREFENLKPLKIAEFEGFYYLLCEQEKYIKLRISKIIACQVSNTYYDLKELDKLKLQHWHNVWHDPNQKPNQVKLWISNEVIEYFYDKNIFYINENTHRVKECDDGVEYYIEITHPLELLPQLMYWLPRVSILEDLGELDILEDFKHILTESIRNTHYTIQTKETT